MAATRAPARHAIAVAERRAESAFSPRFASCPGCSLPSSPSLSLPPIERAPGPLARPDPISPSAARHCRRQARARRGQAIPEPHCLFGRHQNLPRLSLVLYTRSNAAGTRWSTAAGEPHLRRPCSAVEPPPPSTSRRAKTTIRCGVNPSPFSPTFPSPPANPIAGKRRALPCSVCSVCQGLSLRRNKNPGS